jgi:hypothetical protein
MQRICRVEGGVKRYLEDPDCLVSKETRKCPFCADGHALRLHGWYQRWALFPDPERSQKLPVRRLYCPRVRRTVSLLPEFCTPRRQHGPAILALFLKFFLAGACLLEALRNVRREAPCHAVAQSLRDGFLGRSVQIHAYLAQRHRRVVEPPGEVHKDRRRLAELFFGLVAGFKNPQAAFIFHTVTFHEAFGDGLA